MELREIKTYSELLSALQSLTPEQLAQRIQVTVSPNPTAVLLPALAIGTVAEMEFESCRSSIDNRWHDEEVVLLCDRNPFSKKGAIGYELKENSKLEDNPIYTSSGPTPVAAQRNPRAQQHEDEGAGEVAVIKHRSEKYQHLRKT